jgi:hypothetical protein
MYRDYVFAKLPRRKVQSITEKRPLRHARQGVTKGDDDVSEEGGVAGSHCTASLSLILIPGFNAPLLVGVTPANLAGGLPSPGGCLNSFHCEF